MLYFISHVIFSLIRQNKDKQKRGPNLFNATLMLKPFSFFTLCRLFLPAQAARSHLLFRREQHGSLHLNAPSPYFDELKKKNPYAEKLICVTYCSVVG